MIRVIEKLVFIIFIGIGSINLAILKNDIPETVEISTSAGLYPVVRIDTASTCLECHSSTVEHEVVHSPAEKKCDKCHVANGKEHPLDNVAGFDLVDDVPGLCYTCHDSKTEKTNVHDPVLEGDCLKCHDPHGSPNLYVLNSDPPAELCVSCHELKTEGHVSIHEPIVEGKCTGCHDPHQSDNDHFLKYTVPMLCQKCHKAKRKDLKLASVHKPFKEDCLQCHKAHSSESLSLTTEPAPGLCFSCHEDMQTHIDTSALVHSAVTGEETCLGCHSPHASKFENIIREDQKTLCSECHNKTVTNNNVQTINIKRIMLESKFIHGAIDSSGCTACHKPHASEQSQLKVRSFPETNYIQAKPENFALCFECHDSKLMDQPVTISATNFRNSDQNLHYVHLNGEKARNCNFCHNVHGANNSHLISEYVPFGKWKMPIKFIPDENGGSCAPGCHKEQKYSRLGW